MLEGPLNNWKAQYKVYADTVVDALKGGDAGALQEALSEHGEFMDEWLSSVMAILQKDRLLRLDRAHGWAYSTNKLWENLTSMAVLGQKTQKELAHEATETARMLRVIATGLEIEQYLPPDNLNQ